jgi:hypothetical protein
MHGHSIAFIESISCLKVDNIPSTKAPLLFELIQMHLPAGVNLQVREVFHNFIFSFFTVACVRLGSLGFLALGALEK